ncbi:MAG: T9SS type A sorting domain-containing protein [Bacteroidia bacterium]|nr:T9SS type A sorting domain-containing protein [Bacteroidia bacterium]
MRLILLSALLIVSCKLLSQNKGLSFNQTYNNYITTPNNSAINVTNNFTIEFWLQPSKTETWAVLLQEGKCTTALSSYNVAINTDSTISFTFNCTGNCNDVNSYKCTTKIYATVCVHVAISYSSTGVKMYYNGILQPGQYTTGGYCGNLYSSADPLLIGVYRFLNGTLGSYYDGLLDELRIWGKVLTPSEILASYQDTLLGNETNLRLYYKFNTPIYGTGITVNNYATATGSALNGLTYSTNTTTPYNSNSCFINTEIEEHTTNINEFRVYPNPATNNIIITGKNIKQIEIYNLLGEKMYSIQSPQITNDIDITSIQKGIYFIKIFDKENVYIEKIVKQ